MCRMTSIPVRAHTRVSTAPNSIMNSSNNRKINIKLDRALKIEDEKDSSTCQLHTLSDFNTSAITTTLPTSEFIAATAVTPVINNSSLNNSQDTPGVHLLQQVNSPNGVFKSQQIQRTFSRGASWLQQSIIRRTVSFVENEIEHLLESSSFLKNRCQTCIPVAGISSDIGGEGDTNTIALFHRSEIVTGQCLGKGGFSQVYEIIDFQLDENVQDRLTLEQQEIRKYYVDSCTHEQTGRGRYAIKYLKESLLSPSATSEPSPQLSHQQEQKQEIKDVNHRQKKITTKMMSTKNTFQNAVTDLVAESLFMSCLDHPNILKVRGLPVDGILSLKDGKHDGYFLMMDSLDHTLHHSIHKDWLNEEQNIREKQSFFESFHNYNEKSYNSNVQASMSSSEKKRELICTKVEYALQLADAIDYLHSNNIIFRDLKPHNVGFVSSTANSDMKAYTGVGTDRLVLFDFGLCRELPNTSDDCYDDASVFEMSGVGTRRYMAPEVVNGTKYNKKADVYSWSMVFWEMLSCKKPFADYSIEEHEQFVCNQGQRPVTSIISQDLRQQSNRDLEDILTMTWKHDIADRFTMKQVRDALQSFVEQLKGFEEHLLPTGPATAIHEARLSTSSSFLSNRRNASTSSFYQYLSSAFLNINDNENHQDVYLPTSSPTAVITTLDPPCVYPPPILCSSTDMAAGSNEIQKPFLVPKSDENFFCEQGHRCFIEKEEYYHPTVPMQKSFQLPFYLSSLQAPLSYSFETMP